MLFREINRKFYSEAQEGGDAGGGGTKVTPEIEAMIEQAVNEKTQILKNKNSELVGKLKDSSEKLKQFDGIDPETVRTILQRFSDDEEAKLISAGKIDEVLNKRTERFRNEFDKKLKAEQEKADNALKKVEKYSGIVLSNQMTSAALKAGALPEALEDIGLRAKGMFILGDDGEAVAIGQDGDPLLGKDGKTPLTPQEWVESLKDNAPHLFSRAEGTGGGGHKAGSSNLVRSKMTSTEKHNYIQKYGQQAYLKLPKY
ncbi:hypothetical protein [Gilliamella sp. B2828]|uniref:hypothetical protein n=1 Tax=Gilliamella sp. B2828 TaxID=2817974 RepID=UPI00226A4F9B|nr:hypothetical protein [Gilliamella sp. B2828]MCX8696556.1 hypothetical protein [Gilliamella sp. B2828]